MPDKVPCSCCQVAVAKHQVVSCSICKNVFFHDCVELTTAEVRALNSKNSKLHWTCDNCKSLSNELNQLKLLISDLQKDIREMKKQSLPRNDTDPEFLEAVISEIEERQKRKQNIIIFGINEQDSSLDKDARIEEEKTIVSNVLASISDGIYVDNIKMHRLGKFINNRPRPRPIKVVLNNVHEVHDVIKKFSALKKSKARTAQHENISITFDRTPKQVELYKKVKSELIDRKKSGEDNIRIKYINGTPKIVPEN